MKYFVIDTNNGRLHAMSLTEILEAINSDRGPEWESYDETDWKEGLAEFTHFQLLGKIGA